MAAQSADGSMMGWRALAALRDHHLPHMKPELQRALLRRCSNQPVETIARLEGIGFSSARQRVDRATGEVFDTAPVELHRDPYGLGCWVTFHLLCCLKHALAVLQRESEEGAA